MTLLDWIKARLRHGTLSPVAARTLNAPVIADQAPIESLGRAVDDALAAFDRSVGCTLGALEVAGVTALMVRTDRMGTPMVCMGSAVTPDALRALAKWADAKLAQLPNPDRN